MTLRPLDLMRAHVEALFTHDAAGRLLRVNASEGGAAPRFFLGRTTDGPLLRVRHDVDDALRLELEAAAARGAAASEADDALSPIDPAPFAAILARRAPVERSWVGPAFAFPPRLPQADERSVRVTAADATLFEPHLTEWIPDLTTCQPMVALVLDGHAVAVCASVRCTAVAHEAGVETAAAVRGRGYAAAVVAAWARAVRELGRVPLYSTAWQNTASQAVARKLALVPFGSDVHLT